MPFAVIAHYRIEPSDADTVRRALRAMKEPTAAEPGNIAYLVHESIDDKGDFALYEQYTDRAAFEAHKQTPHFAEHIVATVFPVLVERTVTFAEVL
jgi:quinol monooxygenase YgiN